MFGLFCVSKFSLQQVVRALSRTWGDVWTPLIDLDQVSSKAKGEFYWIVDVTGTEIMVVSCRGSDYPKVPIPLSRYGSELIMVNYIARFFRSP